MSPFQDTSKRGTRKDRGLPVTPRPRWWEHARVFFAWSRTGKTRAPKGYGFNPRGDLCKLPPGVEAREAA